MSVLLAILGVIGAALALAGIGVLFVRWVFKSDTNGRSLP